MSDSDKVDNVGDFTNNIRCLNRKADMGYLVRRLTNKKGRKWKIQLVTYKGGIQSIKDIGNDNLLTHGFRPDMSLDEARAWAKSCNAKEEIKRYAVRKEIINERLAQEDLALNAFLNPMDVQLFEASLFERLSIDEVRKLKLQSHWRAAKRIITELKLEPSEWAEGANKFYDVFSKKQMSPAYVWKVLRLLNLWGKFVSRRHKTFFEAIPNPRGYERERIADKYFEKTEKGLASEPLTPLMLENKKSELHVEIFNWLYLSVWLGLRPSEVDSLHDSKTYKLETVSGVRVLYVYQTKLKSVPRDKRWKPIPCFLPEQQKTFNIIQLGNFKRPLAKTLRHHFGERVTCYGGRKGFTDLMLARGQGLEDISVWMGHTTIERTWKSYKNKQQVSWKKAA